MKSPIIFVAALSALMVSLLSAYADAVELSIAPVYHIYSDTSLDNGKGIELGLSHKGYFLNVSGVATFLRFGGQEAQYLTIYGVSLGHKRALPKLENIEGFFSLDIAIPSAQSTRAFTDGNGAWYAFNILGPYGDDYHWDHYSFHLDPGIGCTLGGRYLHRIGKRLILGVGLSWRILRLSEEVYGWNGSYDPLDPHWEIFTKRNVGGMRLEFVFGW